MRYLALLRGINVGRAKRVPMTDLRAVIEQLGFNEVETVLNSGSAVFSGPRSPASEIARDIRKGVNVRVDVDAPVTVLSSRQVDSIAEENPFSADLADPSRILITVFSDLALRSEILPMLEQDWQPESFSVGQRACYTVSPNGVLNSRCLLAVDRKFADRVTTRNMRTFDRLLKLV